MIPFNLPFTAGRESEYLQQALASQQISGKGPFGLWCEQFIEQTWGFERCLLTPSCSAALEMIALLLDLRAGDEVILPSFTFVSTANAFVLRGAVPVFCDSSASHPNLDVQAVEALITPKTRALVAVHYAGMACDLPALRALADRRGLYLIEDAAQAIDAYGLWGGAGQALPLGRFGHLAAFSFHETKNLMCGEGGCLLINDPSFLERAEILRDKGTNRSQFERGLVHHYTWCGLGGAYVLSELSAAYLRGQLEQTTAITARRKQQWDYYHQLCQTLLGEDHPILSLPQVPPGALHNGHTYYLCTRTPAQRQSLLAQLRNQGIGAVFHYQALHSSPFGRHWHSGAPLPHAQYYSQCLIRLPLYHYLSPETQQSIVLAVKNACHE
jgi:dTDP-4-amino-4,6-dideoxygalactose transaminase